MDGVLILTIETATGCGSVAITRGTVNKGRLLAEVTAQPEITHSRRLLGSVDWVMKAATIDWSDLDGIAVSLGPGSFTGLRIGMAAAKGLAFAADIPFLGVQTMDAIALSCPGLDRPLWCVLDARKQEVYAACYLPAPSGRSCRHSAIEAIRPEQLIQQITESSFVTGSGVDEYVELFSGEQHLRILPSTLSTPSAARMGFVAAEQLARGEILDPVSAAPFYVRASEAEINLKKKST